MSVDFKLGLRMLRKYPGLTAVALFALSLAIGAGAAYLEFVNDLLHGKLPFPEADRIVGIQVWDQQSGDPRSEATANFVAWRDSLRSFEELAAYRALDRNLITDDGRAEPVRGVEISAAAFRIAQCRRCWAGRCMRRGRARRRGAGRGHRLRRVDDAIWLRSRA